mgnify:CR=1 FL=1
MEQIKILALYKFTYFDSLLELKLSLSQVCEANEVLGSILISNEGLNGTIGGLEKNIDCRNFDNIILSWNLRNSKYFEEYKIKDIFLVSKIWQKKKFFIKKKRDNLKKIILAQLYKKLNLINKIDYSQKNWEIILEPWLSHYVESNYFRWLIVESLILKYKNFKYFKIKVLKKIPEFDSIEFAEKNYSNDVFNHLSFQDILDFKTRSKKNKIVIKKKFLLNNKLFTRKKK